MKMNIARETTLLMLLFIVFNISSVVVYGSEDDSHDGHDHGGHDDHGHGDEHGHEEVWSWAGIYDLSVGNYALEFSAETDEKLKCVIVEVTEATESAFEEKDEVIEEAFENEEEEVSVGDNGQLTVDPVTLHDLTFADKPATTTMTLKIESKGYYAIVFDDDPNEWSFKLKNGDDIVEASKIIESDDHVSNGNMISYFTGMVICSALSFFFLF